MNVLVTGAFGWTAKSILEAIRQSEHEITTFDLVSAEWPPHIIDLECNVVLGSVAEYDAVYQAMMNMDAVVHLAVAVGRRDYDSPNIPFDTNVRGTYNVFEAARQRGIAKVVLMSEAAVHVPYAHDEIISATDRLRTSYDPREHLYDLTKRLQEEIARDYAETYGLDVVVLRPGHIVDGYVEVDPHGRPLSDLDYLLGGWVCRYDLAEAVVNALNLDFGGYNAFHIVGSEESRKQFDVESAERALGMKIMKRFEKFSKAARV